MLCHNEAMKPHTPELVEGPEAFARFRDAMRAVLTVPSTTIQKRVAEHREEAAKNPNKRGPKPKASVSRAPAV